MQSAYQFFKIGVFLGLSHGAVHAEANSPSVRKYSNRVRLE